MNGPQSELNFAQPVAASCPTAESIHNDGLSFFLSLPQTRRCSKCRQFLPLDKFGSKGKQGVNRRCKTCMAPQKKAYKKKWVQTHRAHVNAYANKYRLKNLPPRPPITPCPSCGSTNLHWKNNRWNCAPCNRKANRIKSWAINNQRKKAKDVARYTEKIERLHGKEMADAYAQIHREHPKTRVRVPMDRLVQLAAKNQNRHLSLDNAQRVILLNKLSNQPLFHFGWTCSKCPVHSDDFRFFDVDHILPRSKKGPGTRINLQIVCPNCHRTKTIADLYR